MFFFDKINKAREEYLRMEIDAVFEDIRNMTYPELLSFYQNYDKKLIPISTIFDKDSIIKTAIERIKDIIKGYENGEYTKKEVKWFFDKLITVTDSKARESNEDLYVVRSNPIIYDNNDLTYNLIIHYRVMFLYTEIIELANQFDNTITNYDKKDTEIKETLECFLSDNYVNKLYSDIKTNKTKSNQEPIQEDKQTKQEPIKQEPTPNTPQPNSPTEQEPTKTTIKRKQPLRESINNFLQDDFDKIITYLSRDIKDENGNITKKKILEPSDDTNYEYKWNATLRDFVYFVALINGQENTKIGNFLKEPNPNGNINWKIFLDSIEVRDTKGNVINDSSRCSQKYNGSTYGDFKDPSNTKQRDETCYRIYQIVMNWYKQPPTN